MAKSINRALVATCYVSSLWLMQADTDTGLSSLCCDELIAWRHRAMGSTAVGEQDRVLPWASMSPASNAKYVLQA